MNIWFQAAADISRGRLPPSIVTPDMVRRVLGDISKEVQSYKSRLGYTQVSQVYKHPEFSVVHVDEHLIVMVKFPVVIKDPFEVYKIHLNPLPMPHQVDDTMTLQTDKRGIAIRQDKSIFCYVDVEEMLLLQAKTAVSKTRLFHYNPKQDLECLYF